MLRGLLIVPIRHHSNTLGRGGAKTSEEKLNVWNAVVQSSHIPVEQSRSFLAVLTLYLIYWIIDDIYIKSPCFDGKRRAPQKGRGKRVIEHLISSAILQIE